ncbi:MAG: helix-turn-helix domain-containing protein [Bacteroidetes bacterium]|nr:helix-turn-helix domain-containing protein [Bacteroidota bacterium]
MKNLSERIHSLRKQKGITQADLAKLIGISLTQMARYETKGIQPPADVLSKLAGAFGTTVDFLINGATEEKAQACLKDAELLNQFQAIEKLPKEKQFVIKDLIDAYLFRTNIQQQLAR